MQMQARPEPSPMDQLGAHRQKRRKAEQGEGGHDPSEFYEGGLEKGGFEFEEGQEEGGGGGGRTNIEGLRRGLKGGLRRGLKGGLRRGLKGGFRRGFSKGASSISQGLRRGFKGGLRSP